jgi:hypothetical protein
VSEELNYKFSLALGDPSRDGHGICEHFYYRCNFPNEVVGKAYKEAKKKNKKLNPSDLCCDYEYNTISKEIFTKILETFPVLKQRYTDEDTGDFYPPCEEGEEEVYIDSGFFADFVIEFIKSGNKDLVIELEEQPSRLEIGSLGYGLFSH